MGLVVYLSKLNLTLNKNTAMLEKVIEDIITEILKDAEPMSKDTIKEAIKMVDDLLSGEAYKNFLNVDMSEPIVRNYVIKNIGTCLLTMVRVPDEVLAKCSKDLKSRMLDYLGNIDIKFTKVLDETRDRIKKSLTAQINKKPENMTREELLDYIESKWKKD